MSMPPTKPTLPVFDAMAASMPTRNEPSCSLNTTDCTLGRSTTLSMIANLVFGNSFATFSSGVGEGEADATIGSSPRCGEAAQRLLALGLVA